MLHMRDCDKSKIQKKIFALKYVGKNNNKFAILYFQVSEFFGLSNVPNVWQELYVGLFSREMHMQLKLTQWFDTDLFCSL